MVVVSSCREMLGSVPQRAQPLTCVTSAKGRGLTGDCRRKSEEGGDDVKSSCP